MMGVRFDKKQNREDIFGQEGRTLPYHHAKRGTFKTNPALSQSYNALE